MKIWTKELYEVKNEDGNIEYHYRTYHISFKSKTQLPLVMVYTEDWYRVIVWADAIYLIDWTLPRIIKGDK